MVYFQILINKTEKKVYQEIKKFNKKSRSRQDSNLRGETPMDFKSIALTTRPRLQLMFLQPLIEG